MAKVLIVEDYPELRDFFKLLLELNKFEVKTAATGAELNSVLDTFIPDLILLDVMLGGENGRDICKQLKQTHKDIFIILISANHKLLVDYKECDADDVIEKPFNIDEVLTKIKKLLQKQNI